MREIQIKTTQRVITLYLSGCLLSIRKEITNAGNGGEKGILLHCQRECKLVQSLWKIVWQFLKKLKIKITIWSSNTTSGYT